MKKIFGRSARLNAAICLLAFAPSPAVRAQSAPAAREDEFIQEPTLVPFGEFFNIRPYSPTFGLALWESRENSLNEISFAGRLRDKSEDNPRENSPADKANGKLAEEWRDRFEKRIKTLAKERTGDLQETLAARNLLWVNDYEKLGLNRQLRFKDEKGSALLLRVREKFQMLNEETGGATFFYSDDRKSSSSGYSFSGALMLDLYLSDLYNLEDLDNPMRSKKPWWIENPYRFWLRLGLEKDENTLDEKNEKDFFRQYALLNFQANPDQNARIFAIPGLEIVSPQIVQLGFVHQSNRITDEDSTNWIVGWEPRLLVTEGWFGSRLGRGFALNNRMYYKEGGHFGELATRNFKNEDGEVKRDADEIVNQRSEIFSFVNPKVDIEGSADSRVTLPDFGKVKDYDSLKKLQDEVVSYELALGLGYDFKSKLPGAGTTAAATASYTLRGIQPISSLDDGHFWHELRAEFNLFQSFTQAGATAPGKNDWAGMTAYVSWVSGEAPPTYVDSDLLTAGLTVRF